MSRIPLKTNNEQKRKDFKLLLICVILFFLLLITFALVVYYEDGLNLTSDITLGFLMVDVICIDRLSLMYLYS